MNDLNAGVLSYLLCCANIHTYTYVLLMLLHGSTRTSNLTVVFHCCAVLASEFFDVCSDKTLHEACSQKAHCTVVPGIWLGLPLGEACNITTQPQISKEFIYKDKYHQSRATGHSVRVVFWGEIEFKGELCWLNTPKSVYGCWGVLLHMWNRFENGKEYSFNF